MYLLVVYSIDYSTCVSYYYYIIYLEGNTVVYCVYITYIGLYYIVNIIYLFHEYLIY